MSRCLSGTPPIVPESRLFFDRLRYMGSTLDNRIAAATDSLPVDLQRPVKQWFERLREQHGLSSLPGAEAEALVRLVACSEFGAQVILQNWQWFVENVASFADAYEPAENLPDVVTDGELDIDALKSALRRFRNRTLLRILWREIFGLADLDETLAHLTRLADLMLDVATRSAARALEPRFGSVRDSSGQAVSLVILAMGKLGGNELNFSSDIDLIFLFTQDGETDGAKTVSAQEYFGRLTRLIIALIDEDRGAQTVFRETSEG